MSIEQAKQSMKWVFNQKVGVLFFHFLIFRKYYFFQISHKHMKGKQNGNIIADYSF